MAIFYSQVTDGVLMNAIANNTDIFAGEEQLLSHALGNTGPSRLVPEPLEIETPENQLGQLRDRIWRFSLAKCFLDSLPASDLPLKYETQGYVESKVKQWLVKTGREVSYVSINQLTVDAVEMAGVIKKV